MLNDLTKSVLYISTLLVAAGLMIVIGGDDR